MSGATGHITHYQVNEMLSACGDEVTLAVLMRAVKDQTGKRFLGDIMVGEYDGILDWIHEAALSRGVKIGVKNG